MNSKTAIFYYSATGNSLYVAKQLTNKLPGSELIPIIPLLKGGCNQLSEDFNTVGLVFPVHNMCIPWLVRDFLETFLMKPNTYVFAVLTGGNPEFSAGLFQINKILKKQDQQMHAGFHLRMPATYFSRFPFYRKQQISFDADEVNKKIDAICSSVTNKEEKIENGFKLLSWFNFLKTDRNTISASFIIDEGCIRCGYCVMVCPLQNIQLKGKEHLFLSDCNGCMACVHYCSKQVIQFKNLSRRLPRYQHPSITIGELMAQKRKTVSKRE